MIFEVNERYLQNNSRLRIKIRLDESEWVQSMVKDLAYFGVEEE